MRLPEVMKASSSSPSLMSPNEVRGATPAKRRRNETRRVPETETPFVSRLGVSMSEVTQRLVTDEVLRAGEARHIHRLLVANDSRARDAVLRLEEAGGSGNSRAVAEFRRTMLGEVKERRVVLPRVQRGEVPVIEGVCATFEQRARRVKGGVVLVGRGHYNPIHNMHLRHFKIARQFLEERTGSTVFGGLLVPKHATEVRQRLRTRPSFIIPARHRLAMARAAVGASSWLTVDPWEITRRRVLDYLTTLDHVRQLFEGRFPQLPIRLVLLVAPEELVQLNLDELKDAGYSCITVCRPLEHGRLLAQIGSRWTSVAHVVEDRALLAADLEAVTTEKLRRDLVARHEAPPRALPAAVADYVAKHQIAHKMAGTVRWTKADKDLPFFDHAKQHKDRAYRRQPRVVHHEATLLFTS